MHRVFVYGSLKRGFGNHRLLEDQKFEGVHITSSNEWEMLSMGGFPAIIRPPEGQGKIIEGEVYTVNDRAIQSLDWLEGNGSFYQREEVDTTAGVVWMYVLMHHHDYGRLNKTRVSLENNIERWIA